MTTAPTKLGDTRTSPSVLASRDSMWWLRRAFFIMLLALAVATAAFLGTTLLHLRTAVDAVREVEAIALTLRGGPPAPEALDRAQRALATANGELTALRGQLRPLYPLFENIGWLPWWGQEASTAPQLLEIGVTATRAAERSLLGLGPAFRAFQRRSAAPELLAALAAGKPALQEALTDLSVLASLRESIKPTRSLHPALESILARLDAYLPTFREALGGALLLPQLLGNDSPHSYLLLGQNNDELRATGGFISTAGILSVSKGAVQQFDYRDSYAFDAEGQRLSLTPPAPYQRYMLFQDWRLRDANWWADFPTSARQAQAFLWAEQGLRVDGVIAFDQTLLERVLAVLGPLDVPTFQERVDASNVTAIMEAYAHPPGYKEGVFGEDPRKVNVRDRKAFIRELALVLLDRVQRLDGGILLKLARTVQTALEEKHLLLYFQGQEAAQLVTELGWDGALGPSDGGDFLMVVETNVGYSKANRYVQRWLDYHVQLGYDRSPESATVTLMYQNRNGDPARHCAADVVDFYTSDDSCYKSYVRVYTPLGAIPVSAFGLEGPYEWFTESERAVLAGLVVLPPGASRRVEFTYLLPRSVVRPGSPPSYELRLQKQPGTDSLPTTVTVSYPQQASSYSENHRTSFTLQTDERLIAPLP